MKSFQPNSFSVIWCIKVYLIFYYLLIKFNNKLNISVKQNDKIYSFISLTNVASNFDWYWLKIKMLRKSKLKLKMQFSGYIYRIYFKPYIQGCYWNGMETWHFEQKYLKILEFLNSKISVWHKKFIMLIKFLVIIKTFFFLKNTFKIA